VRSPTIQMMVARGPSVSVVVFWVPGTVPALDEALTDERADVGSAGVFRPESDGRQLTFTRPDGPAGPASHAWGRDRRPGHAPRP
jgi:hypothetical protein